MTRIDRLRELLEEPLLITNLVNVRYLTGFDSSNAALFVEPERARLFTDFRYFEAARGIEGVETVMTKRSLMAWLGETLRRPGWFRGERAAVVVRRGSARRPVSISSRGKGSSSSCARSRTKASSTRSGECCAITDRMFERLVTEIPFVGRPRARRRVGHPAALPRGGRGGRCRSSRSSARARPAPAAWARRREGHRGGRARRHRYRRNVGGYVSDYTRTLATGELYGEMREAYDTRSRGAAGGSRRDPRRRHRRGRRRAPRATSSRRATSTGSSATGSAMGSASTSTRLRASRRRAPTRSRRATSSPSSRASTSRAASASGSRTTSSSPTTASRTRCGSRRNSSLFHDQRARRRRRRRRRPRRPGGGGRAHEAGKRVVLVDQEGPSNLGGQAYWSFGGLFLVDSPEQRRMRSQGLARPRLAGLGRQRRLRPARRRGQLGGRWAARLRRVRRRREARLAARARACRSSPTVGWAERGGCAPTGTATPCRASTSPGAPAPAWSSPSSPRRAQAGDARPADDPAPAPRRRAHRRAAAPSTGVRGAVLAADDAPRGAPTNREVVGEFELARRLVIVTSGGIGGNHELVRRFWPERLGTAAALDAHRRARVRRRPHARHRRAARAHASSTATACGTTPRASRNWDPDLAGPRHPHPARPVVAVVRRARQAAARAVPARLRHARHARAPAQPDMRPRPLVVRPHPEDHREGVRALGLRAEPRPHRQGPARARAPALLSKGAPAPGRGVQAARRRLRRRRHARRARRRDERPLPGRAAARPGEHPRRRSWRATASSTTSSRRTRSSRPCAAPASTAATSSSASPRRTASSTRRPGRSSRSSCTSSPARPSAASRPTSTRARSAPTATRSPGLYAAGEVAGFGGGGVHGYRALEGTFLGGCLFTGRAAGRDAAQRLGG